MPVIMSGQVLADDKPDPTSLSSQQSNSGSSSPSPSQTTFTQTTPSTTPAPQTPSPSPSTSTSTSTSPSPSPSSTFIPSSSAKSSTITSSTSTPSSLSTTTTVATTTTASVVNPVTSSAPTSPSPVAFSSSIVLITTDSAGSIVTSTTFTTPLSSLLPASASPSGSASDKGFFQNTGAVAGTFTAVGLVGLALLIFLVTFIIRRRRQAKFDRELNEATLEAANTSAPPFIDTNDGYDGYDPAGGVYSDASSHGTYAQPPMSTEAYGMREIGPGVAGVGVGMTSGYAHGYDYDQYPPAAAYARPQQAQVYPDYAQAQSYPQDTPYRSPNSTPNSYAPNAEYTYPTAPSPSQGHPQGTSQEGHAYYPPHAVSPELQLLEAAGLDTSPAAAPTGIQRGISLNHNHPREHESEHDHDPYGGYVGLAHEHDHAGDDRGSYYEEAQVPRVLKIANA